MAKKGTQTILWWIIWITLTIVAFFVAVVIWNPIIHALFGSVKTTKAAAIWVAAVFGTWMVILVPLIVVMYQKVDKAYEDARMKREKNAERFKSIKLDQPARMLPKELSGKLKKWPEAIGGGHLVTVVTKSNQRFEHVFVQNHTEILGIYKQSKMPFSVDDISTIEPSDLDHLPAFIQNQWLRLDGVALPE